MSFDQRMGRSDTTNANTTPSWLTPEGSEGMEGVKSDSTVEGDNFPKAPSSHESPSIFYDPLALLVKSSIFDSYTFNTVCIL